MKVQLQDRSMRLRVARAELATLLDGGRLRLSVPQAAGPLFDLEVTAGDSPGLVRAPPHGWRLCVPADDLRAFEATLPRRDGLSYRLEGDLSVDIEVDVRGR